MLRPGATVALLHVVRVGGCVVAVRLRQGASVVRGGKGGGGVQTSPLLTMGKLLATSLPAAEAD